MGFATDVAKGKTAILSASTFGTACAVVIMWAVAYWAYMRAIG